MDPALAPVARALPTCRFTPSEGRGHPLPRPDASRRALARATRTNDLVPTRVSMHRDLLVIDPHRRSIPSAPSGGGYHRWRHLIPSIEGIDPPIGSAHPHAGSASASTRMEVPTRSIGRAHPP